MRTNTMFVLVEQWPGDLRRMKDRKITAGVSYFGTFVHYKRGQRLGHKYVHTSPNRS